MPRGGWLRINRMSAAWWAATLARMSAAKCAGRADVRSLRCRNGWCLDAEVQRHRVARCRAGAVQPCNPVMDDAIVLLKEQYGNDRESVLTDEEAATRPH